jgi:hypothetical protein
MWNHSSTQIGLIGTLELQGMLRNRWWKNKHEEKQSINPNWIDWDFRASRDAKKMVMKKQTWRKTKHYWFAGDGCEVRVRSLWVLKWLLLTVLQSVHKIHCCIILVSKVKLSDTLKTHCCIILVRFSSVEICNKLQRTRTWHSFQGKKKSVFNNWEISINVTPPKDTTTKCFGPSRKPQRGKVLERVLGDLFQIWFRKCDLSLLSA